MAASVPSAAPVREDPAIPAAAVRRQLERILDSPQFRSSESLKRFLRHVVEETLAGNGERIKESVIGADLFGRGADFDPRVDNIVRVSAHRLRSRLNKYYAAEGASDEVVIEVPRGHYTPVFRAQQTTPDEPAPVLVAPERRAKRFRAPLWRVPVQPKFALFGVSLLAVGLLLGWGLQHWAAPDGTVLPKVAPELAEFWGPVFANQERPVIIAFSNPVFLRTADGDLVRYRGESSKATDVAVSDPNLLASLGPSRGAIRGPLRFNTTYTGTGEVQAVHDLTRVLVSGGARTSVRRSRLLLVSDFSNHDVVVIGSPVGNHLLSGVWGDRDYRFTAPGSTIELADPEPGEPAKYYVENDPETGARVVDYGLISVLPGLHADRRLIVLGGCGTSGTRGAAEFVTNPASLRQLADAFDGKLPSYFQALVKTPIINDQVSPSKLLSVRAVGVRDDTRRSALSR